MNPSRRPAPSSNTWLIVAIVLVLLLLIVLFTCHRQRGGSGSAPPVPRSVDTSALRGLELPAIRPGDEIVQHTAYTLSYREANEQAAWVAYVATGAHTLATHYERTNNFAPDPLVPTGSATNADYEGSGYDRGHLAPAEDMAWSQQTMAESFYYSNMSPQMPAFNRGVWKRLEELVRYWSTVYDSLYVVTGPILTSGLPVIGPDHVSVPQYYYKAVLVYGVKGAQAIAFVLPNEASAATLRQFAVSIDEVEQRTGLDLFPRLPDELEAKLEAGVETTKWKWTRRN